MPSIARSRIGIDFGRQLPLEDAIDWAARRGVSLVDVQLDTGRNHVTSFDGPRADAVRLSCDKHAIHLGLHTLSAVNVAEYAPLVAEAVDAYLAAYVDAAARLGAGWIVVHAGYHFTADAALRRQASLERLRRIADYAESKAVVLLLENLNKEPRDAEVRYLASTFDEWRWFYERIDQPALQLSFTANHAHLVPEGVDGFVSAMPLPRVREVRLADCFRNGHEQHLNPGDGDFDFPALFRSLEEKGYTGHYMNAFGDLEDMLRARELFAGMSLD